MIVLDTSILIDSLTGPRRSAPAFHRVVERGERLLLPSLVIYEWRRGPRLPQELAVFEALFPVETTIPFTHHQAEVAADLYRAVSRLRGREIDIAIAACAIAHDADLWTLNPADFRDLPGLRLYPFA